MATWKKVIVSGSSAELGQLNVGANQQINTSPASTFLSGSFSGSFFGDGSGLNGVAASFPITAKTDLATTDKFFINDGASKFVTYGNLVTDLAGAGAGTSNLTTGDTGDSLALTAQISVTGVTASVTGNLTGTATNATNTAITDTTTGTGPYYVTFVDATTGNAAQRVDSTGLTYNATTNTLTVTSSFATIATSASFATTASFATSAATATNATNTAVTDTTSGTGPYYVTFVDGTTGNRAQLVDSNGLTFNATTNTLTVTSSAALNSLSASYAGAVNNLTNAITNNADNRVLTATGGGTINGEGNLTFDGTTLTVTGNEIITGNLIVQGTASFQQTTNLEVADRFVLLASGSNAAGDGGLVIQQATQNVGELFGYESSINRWGFTSSFTANVSSYTPSAYITTTEVGVTTPPVSPVYGGSGNGFGNIYVKTDTGDIFIYS